MASKDAVCGQHDHVRIEIALEILVDVIPAGMRKVVDQDLVSAPVAQCRARHGWRRRLALPSRIARRTSERAVFTQWPSR